MASRYLGRRKLRIGTRGSELAMIQTEMVIDALTAVGVEAEVVVIRSRGARLKNKPLQDFGGKSVFVTDFEDAILNCCSCLFYPGHRGSSTAAVFRNDRSDEYAFLLYRSPAFAL